MGKTSDKLNYLNDTKKAIKSAIVNRGVSVSDADTFRSYANKIGSIGETVEKVKYGISVDSFMGDVDENGVLQAPTEPFILNLAGVKGVVKKAFYNKFYNSSGIKEIIANDLTSVADSAFYNACSGSGLEKAHFDNIEEITADDVFYNFVQYTSFLSELSFKKLRKAIGGNVFYNAAYSTAASKQYVDKMFPSLEEAGGSNCLGGVINKAILRYSKLKKITGGVSYAPTFGSNNVEYFFPRATEMSGYVFYSVVKKVHFAAQNQATIEALPDYTIKFGGTNVTIYFDLMLQITVNGVVYEREHTIDGYTSWKDANGNLVYTDETAEPVVGTVVYSDQGTTQVGTVEGVA